MLPQSLVSVYKEYKKDTDSIATWLASTAKECGYPAALLPSKPGAGTGSGTPAPSGRLKGKARTAAKKKAKGKGEPSTKPQGGPAHRYIISIKDFVPLAECISTSKIPSLCVPHVFFTTLDRVIFIRSGFSQELNDHDVALDAQSDAKHSYFVGILQKVAEVLERFRPSAAPRTPDPLSASTNKFNALKVYLPSEEFLNAPDIERPQATTGPAEIFEVDPSQSLVEAIVAFRMMCIDLGEIRALLSSLWARCASDQGSGFDPAVLAIVTNTGIEFGKNIIEEMLPIFEPHGGIRKVMDHHLSLIPMAPNQSIINPDSWNMDSESAEETYNILSRCCFMVCSVLDTLKKLPWLGPTFYPEGHFGKLDHETTWKSKTVDEKFKQDNLITTELYFEASALVHHVPDYPFSDEFVRGVKECKETQKIPFSLVFAAQVNLDIHHVIGDYAETSIDTLLKRLSHMEGMLQSTIDFHTKLKSPHWSSSNQQWLQETLEGFEWFLKDPLHEVRKLALSDDLMGQVMAAGIKKWRLLRRSPIMAGLALHYHRAEMHEAGLNVTNQWGSIILPAHLYNAVSEEGYTQTVWPDMERLLATFGAEQFFVGGKPGNTSDYVNRFMLQVGVSASALTNRRRRSKRIGIDDFSRAGARFLTTRAKFHRHFQTRYHKNKSQMNWTPESISEILSLSRASNKMGQSKTVRASPPELLEALGIALHPEIHELSFPYLLMHRTNWTFLMECRIGWDSMLRENYGPDYIQEKWGLPFIIGQVLALADGVDGPKNDFGLEVAGSLLDSSGGRTITSVSLRQMHMLCGRDYDVPEKELDLLADLAMNLDLGSDDDDEDVDDEDVDDEDVDDEDVDDEDVYDKLRVLPDFEDLF